MNRRKNSLLLTVLLLAFSAGAMVFSRNVIESRIRGEALYVVISMDGKDIFKSRLVKDADELWNRAEFRDGEHLFPEDGKLVFRGERGGENVLVLEEKPEGGTGIRCLSADCPDGICVQTGFAVPDTGSIVCLPHRMVVRLSK